MANVDQAAREGALIAFYECYVRHVQAGVVASLGDYQRMWPGFEDAIAAEYVELEHERLAPLIDAKPGRSPLDVDPVDSTLIQLREVGRYHILRVLDHGGQGIVYLAEDKSLRRQVALKVLTRAGRLSRPTLQRFRREVEISSQLDHPGLCTVFDSGLHEGMLYMVMRFVDGESLSRRIKQARLANETTPRADTRTPTVSRRDEVMQVADLIEKVARALHVAHERGVVHRDIKPGNIMVGIDGEPVLLDFGIARSLENDDVTVTSSGDLVGTPAYMAPEQIQQRGPIDRRADVYALGVTLYELLTPHHPHEAATREALYHAILTKPPPDPRQWNRAISADLKAVLQVALEKQPDRRYQTALDLAEDLRRVREIKPIAARPPSAIARVSRWVRREPVKAGLLGLVLLLLFGVTAAWVDAKRSNRQLATSLARSRIEQGLAFGQAGNTALAETLLWREQLRQGADRVDADATMLARKAYWALWDLYRRQPCLATLAIEPDVNVAFNRDGVFVASRDGSLRQLDPHDLRGGKIRFTAPLDASVPRNQMWFSTDGTQLVCLEHDQLTIRTTLDGRVAQVISLAGDRRDVLSVSYSGNQLMLLRSGTVDVWQLSPPAHWHKPIGFDVRGGVVVDRWALLVPYRDRNPCELWDWSADQLLWRDDTFGSSTSPIKHPTQQAVVMGRRHGVAFLPLSPAAEVAVPAVKAPGIVTALGFDATGERIAMGGRDGLVLTYAMSGCNARSAEPISEYHVEGGDLSRVVWSPDGDAIMTTNRKHLKLWETAPDAGFRALTSFDMRIASAHSVRYSPDGRWLEGCGTGKPNGPAGALQVWDVATGRELFAEVDSQALIASAVFSPNQATLFASDYARSISAWSTRDWKRIASTVSELDGTSHGSDTQSLSQIAVAHDGSLLSVASPDGQVTLFAAATLEPLRVLSPGHQDRIASLGFAPGRMQLATAGLDGTVRLFTEVGADWRGELRRNHSVSVRAVVFSRDGHLLAAGDDLGVIEIDDLERGTVHSIRAHGSRVFALSFDASSCLLASGDEVGVIRVWDVAAGELLLTLTRDKAAAMCMSLDFSPTSLALAAAYTDGVVGIWDLRHYDRHVRGNFDYQLAALEADLDPAVVSWWRAAGAAAISRP